MEEFRLRNYMEDVVDKHIDRVLNTYPEEICRCERCRLDIKAFALNNLHPRYVVTDLGEVYSRLYQMTIQLDVDVVNAIVLGAKIISKSPRHNKN